MSFKHSLQLLLVKVFLLVNVSVLKYDHCDSFLYFQHKKKKDENILILRAMKRHNTDWEKIFAKDVSDKALSSIQFNRSIVSDSLRPHGLQHARPPCPLPTPGAYSNPCPLSRS